MDDHVSPKRRLSDRKSKPSFEDLVDHHKRVESPSRSYDEHRPPVRIRIRLPKLDASNYLNSQVNLSPLSNSPMTNSASLAQPIHSEEYEPQCSNSTSTITTTQNISLSNGLQAALSNSTNGESVLSVSEDEDNLPLIDLCKRVLHPEGNPDKQSTDLLEQTKTQISRNIFSSIAAATSTNSSFSCCYSACDNKAIPTDGRWDGQFCSSECLVKACRKAFSVRSAEHRSKLRKLTNLNSEQLLSL